MAEIIMKNNGYFTAITLAVLTLTICLCTRAHAQMDAALVELSRPETAALDPALVGNWEFTLLKDGLIFHFRLSIGAHATYRISIITEESGILEARAGRWKTISKTQRIADGLYKFSDSDHVLMIGPLGGAIWKRLKPLNTTGAAIDPALVGDWQTEMIIEGMVWRLNLRFKPDGAYRFTAVVEDSGAYEGHLGRWRTVSASGKSAEGSYKFLHTDALSMSGPLGSSIWLRAETSKD